jgi:hypothetical protein
MTPDKIAGVSGTEHANQKALLAWVAKARVFGIAAADDDKSYGYGGKTYAEETYYTAPCLPLDLLYAIPNGGERNVLVAAKLKAEGVRAGVPDLHMPVARGGHHSLYIEMKKTGGRLSDVQIRFIAALEAAGNKVVVAYGWKEAVEAIKQYLSVGTK